MDSNLFWCIMGIIGGAIFSLIISMTFHFISKKRKNILYKIKTVKIISSANLKLNNLELKYNTRNIENLCLSTIQIKNIGNSIIEKEDIASPIHIFTGGQFLINTNNEHALFLISTPRNESASYTIDESTKSCNVITLDFKYISKRSELNFSVYHTDNPVFLQGFLKEGKILDEDEISLFKRIIIKIFF